MTLESSQFLGKPDWMKFVIAGPMLPGAMDAVKAKKPRTHHLEEMYYGRSS
jgi:hypothetical protein